MRTTILLVLLFLAYSCGNSGTTSDKTAPPGTTQPATSADEMQEAMNQAQEAIKKTQMQQPVEPVNFRTLQEVLADKLAGFTLVKKGGETTGTMGMKMSRATGKYRDDDGKNLNLDVVDTGGMGMAMLGTATWANLTIDKEDDNGYERTSTLKGIKSFEKFKKNGATSELSLIAESRYIITAACRGCTMETMRNAVEAIDFDKLKTMK
ncbi:MAG: hypothetical protein IPK76_27070 [Lewinellaceae bacterium]|nr:hypothetical protein [Lewinellaceae bacterium]